MARKPDKEIQKRNGKIRQEFKSGKSKKELAKKYKLSQVSITAIANEGKEVKRQDDRDNIYIPIKLKPGQVVKIKAREAKSIRTVKYRVLKNYPTYVLMERLGIKECFLHYDIWRSVVGGEVL